MFGKVTRDIFGQTGTGLGFERVTQGDQEDEKIGNLQQAGSPNRPRSFNFLDSQLRKAVVMHEQADFFVG